LHKCRSADTRIHKNAVFYVVFDLCPVADFFGATGIDNRRIPQNKVISNLTFGRKWGSTGTKKKQAENFFSFEGSFPLVVFLF